MSTTVSISQADHDLLTNSRKLLNEVYDHPEHGLAVKRAIKAVRPTQPIPELDAQGVVAPVMEKVDALGAALTKFTEQYDNDKLAVKQSADADALARRMAQARDTFKLTDEGVEGMTNLMRDKGIMDPADAAQLYVARNPKAPLSSQRQGRYGSATYADLTGFGDQEAKQKMLLETPDRFLAAEIEACLSEFATEEA